MPIFQKSVIKKNLKNLNQEKVEKAFQKFELNYNSKKILLLSVFIHLKFISLKPHQQVTMCKTALKRPFTLSVMPN